MFPSGDVLRLVSKSELLQSVSLSDSILAKPIPDGVGLSTMTAGALRQFFADDNVPVAANGGGRGGGGQPQGGAPAAGRITQVATGRNQDEERTAREGE